MKKIELTISSRKGICGGIWCVEGTRIPARMLVEYLDGGYTPTAILRKMYPRLKSKLKLK